MRVIFFTQSSGTSDTQPAHTSQSGSRKPDGFPWGDVNTTLFIQHGAAPAKLAAQLHNQWVCCMCYFQEHASTETTGSPRGSVPPQVTDSLVKAVLLESCLPFNLPSLAQSITAQGLLTGIQGEPKVSSASGCMMAWSCYVLEIKVVLYHLEDMKGGLLCTHSVEGSESLCMALPIAILYLRWHLDRNKNSSYAEKNCFLNSWVFSTLNKFI